MHNDIDLDLVVAGAREVLHPDEIQNWLMSANAFIPGHATPLSAARTGHIVDALTALDAEAEGAFS
jgi:hypothetical protein